MRRKDREITDVREIGKIIAKAKYLHLGLFDGDFPYVVPMHYGFQMENGKLIFYMHCAKEGYKLECLKRNKNVFIQIDCGQSLVAASVPCGYGAEYESVMCRGRASTVEDKKEKCKALECLMRTQTNEDHMIDESMAEKVEIIRVDVLSYTAKSWVR